MQNNNFGEHSLPQPFGSSWYFVYPEIYEHRRPVFALVRPDYWIGAFGSLCNDTFQINAKRNTL